MDNDDSHLIAARRSTGTRAMVQLHREKRKQLMRRDETHIAIDFESAIFSGSDLCGSTFADCKFINCDFLNAMLINIRFLNCCLIQCRFVNSDLRGATVQNCDFTGSNFTRADLTDASLAGSILKDCNFEWSWLIHTDLRNADLTGISFENTRFGKTKIYNDRQFRFLLPSEILFDEFNTSPGADGSQFEGREALENLQLQSKNKTQS